MMGFEWTIRLGASEQSRALQIMARCFSEAGYPDALVDDDGLFVPSGNKEWPWRFGVTFGPPGSGVLISHYSLRDGEQIIDRIAGKLTAKGICAVIEEA